MPLTFPADTPENSDLHGKYINKLNSYDNIYSLYTACGAALPRNHHDIGCVER